jgi:hypothetical protein
VKPKRGEESAMAGLERIVEVRLPPEIEYSTLAGLIAGDAAIRAELDLSQRTQMSEAARLAFELVVVNAMNDERVPVRLQFSSTPAEFNIAIADHGLPLDDEFARRDPRWPEILDRVDRAHWMLQGRRGSELHLAVCRPHGLAHVVDNPPPEESVPLAPAQEYTIRRFQPRDAAGVGRAFYQTWGYHYIFPAVYVPKRLIQLNKNNDYISVVAVAENGEIVGHFALDPFAGTPLVDACGAIIVPAHRGRGLLDRLREFAEYEAQHLGFAAYYCEPVTAHPRTQEDSAKIGAQLCAIVLGGLPTALLPKRLNSAGKGQRQSYAIYLKPFKEREARALYIPPQHREIVEAMYGALDLPYEERTGSPAEQTGAVHVDIARTLSRAMITVRMPGSDTAQQIAQVVADARQIGRLGGVYVDLPLEDPGTPALCAQLEGLGFFFCGVIPWFLNGHDALRLQLPLRPIDLSGVIAFGEFGARLKDYIEARMLSTR